METYQGNAVYINRVLHFPFAIGKTTKPVKQLSPLVQEFRNVKSEAEAKVMRQSGEISSKAFIEVICVVLTIAPDIALLHGLLTSFVGYEIYKAWYHRRAIVGKAGL